MPPSEKLLDISSRRQSARRNDQDTTGVGFSRSQPGDRNTWRASTLQTV
nr:hypothetical protein [Argonema antarcticum]